MLPSLLTPGVSKSWAGNIELMNVLGRSKAVVVLALVIRAACESPVSLLGSLGEADEWGGNGGLAPCMAQ